MSSTGSDLTRVRDLLTDEIGGLQRRWNKQWGVTPPDDHNFFLSAFSEIIAKYSGPSRSLTSRLGRTLHGIARGLATDRFGSDTVPTYVFSSSLENVPDDPKGHGNDTRIYSQYDKEVVERQVSRLRELAKREKIGSVGFRGEYERSAEAVQGVSNGPVWTCLVDLVVLDDTLGFVELESGGNLDTSNAKGQTEKLLRAGLALGRTELPLHWAVAYPNAGEEVGYIGGLSTLFVVREAGDAVRDGLLVGKEWWQRILPDGLSYAQFRTLFLEIANAHPLQLGGESLP